MYRWLFSFLFTAMLVMTGCSFKHSPEKEHAYLQQSANQNYMFEDFEEEVAMAPPAAAMGAVDGAGNYGTVSKRAKSGQKATGHVVEAQKQEPQTIHYNGYTRLRVSRAEDVADALSALALEVGGHVEALNPRRVSIRVPVDTFRDVFQKVLDMGDVLDKSISATDISESLTSVKLRLDTARATRDRLVKLLAKAEDETEKLELIRQIQRLTEDIDRLSGQSQTLHDLASYSRITVELVPREALARRSHSADIAELAWIRRLSPFRTAVGAAADRLELEVPEGFVELNRKGQFVVESADGARLWTGRLENQPRGDTDFWLTALQERLAEEFGSAEVSEQGGFKLLRLVDRAEDPYTYIVGVRESGKHLELVEIYYPSAEHAERHAEAIQAIFTGGNS